VTARIPTRHPEFDARKAIERQGCRYDPARLLRGFETTDEVTCRDERLVPALGQIGRHDLANDLRQGLDGRQPLPAWSNSAYRDRRRWFTDTAATLAYEARERTGHLGVTVSVIPAGLIAPLGHLPAISPTHARATTWKALDRAVPGYKAIGGLDVSYNEIAGPNQPPGYYQGQLHIAILGFNSNKKACERLTEELKTIFVLETTARVPVRVQELRDPIEQLSYLLKRLFARRVSIIDNRGRRNTLHRPLKSHQAAEIAAWLSGFAQTDRLLLYGLRRKGNSIVPTGRSKIGGW
jgi:hypothetical protein